MPLDEFGREIPGPTFGFRGPPLIISVPGPGARSGTPRKKSQATTKATTTTTTSETNGVGVGRRKPIGHTTIIIRPIEQPAIVVPPDFNKSTTNNPTTTNATATSSSMPVVEQQRNTTRRYPAFLYVVKALQCEFLFKEEQEQQLANLKEQAEADKTTTTTTTTNTMKIDDEGDENKPIVMPTYEEYRKSYCLNYVRKFFNEHLDDSWFRRRYSSLFRYQDIRNEKERAGQEAEQFLKKLQSGPALGCGNHDLQLTGTKNIASGHWFAFQQQMDPKEGGPASSESTTESTATTIAILVSDMPTHLTDEQLLTALMEERDTGNNDNNTNTNTNKQQSSGLLQIYHVPEKTPYRTRSVIVLGPKRILGPKVETRNDVFTFECCTDPYNRTKIDADGHGGATADGGTVPMTSISVKLKVVIPPHPTVLSATLSTPARFVNDLATAIELASLLDQTQNIPNTCNLQAILNQYRSREQQSQEVEENSVVVDQLDLAVAYLRRVHLRNFYHQPDVPHTFAEMLLSPIYVRMKIVEANLDVEDLLAKHLDDGLTRAVSAAASSSAADLEATLRDEAEAIERDMKETELQWIRDHSIAQTKGRARCSFHFCNKLFQDDTFLQKHLHKKHVEYLLAEQAKCHDTSMMKAWDEATVRPVPEIVVDCGSKFGFVPVPLLEGGVPDVVDPEPRLWKEEEDRLAAHKRRKEEERMKQQQQQQHHAHQHQPTMRRVFVDVDDMPEEKVELTFDTVVATIPPRKKKKRKLL